MGDFRELCAELVEYLALLDEPPHELVCRAHAALAAAPGEGEAIGSEWQPCVKLPITVHVREQRPGETHVSTREGVTPVRRDDLIMRGVQGEEYPIGRELFNRTYRLGAAAPAPTVAEGEGEGLTDEEIMGLMPQQMHDDLAEAVRAMAEQCGTDSTRVRGAMRIILNRHVVDLAHAAIAADRQRRAQPPQGEEVG